jgi:hypothetical protein
MALQRCTECFGRKKIIGMGGMSTICDTCKGEGSVTVDASVVANTPATQPSSAYLQESVNRPIPATTSHVDPVHPVTRQLAPMQVPASHVVKVENQDNAPPLFRNPETQPVLHTPHVLDQKRDSQNLESVPPLFKAQASNLPPIRHAAVQQSGFIKTTAMPDVNPPAGFVRPTATAIPLIDTFDAKGQKIAHPEFMVLVETATVVLAEPTPVNMVAADTSGKGVPVLVRPRGRPKAIKA